MPLTTLEITRLSNDLTAFYMGELIPPADAIRGYYDREVWEHGNPCTMFRDTHMCVECHVEYVGAMKYMGENILAAHITIYCGNRQFSRQIEYWNADHVRRFRNEIVISV